MAAKRLKRPRDPVQLAKLIGDIATGQVEDEGKREPKGIQKGKPSETGRSPAKAKSEPRKR